MALFTLVHSPSVGPATWMPVADRLRDAGHETVVPSLLTVADGGAPYWPSVVAAVRAALAGADPARPVVLVPHSNAGLFVPVLARDLGRPVACAIFADASVPAEAGATPVVGDDFLPFLRELADHDGLLPRWTDWWTEDDVAPMLPDPVIRVAVTEEQPRLPMAYYLERIPAPVGWDDLACSYLQFSKAYDTQAAEARRRGWLVRHVPGEHLHQVVDPDAVTRTLLELVSAATQACRDSRPRNRRDQP
jgi:hypothetical protein